MGSDSHATGSSLLGSEGSEGSEVLLGSLVGLSGSVLGNLSWGVSVAPRLSGLVARGVRAVGSRSNEGFCEGFPRRLLFGLDLYGSLGVNSAARLSRFVARGVRAEGSRSRGGFCEGVSGGLLSCLDMWGSSGVCVTSRL